MNSSAFSRNGIYHNCGNSSQRERGRSGRGSWRNNNKPQCQLYGRIGHVVIQCYYRFDQSFSGPSQLLRKPSIKKHSLPSTTTLWTHLPRISVDSTRISILTPEVSHDTNWHPDYGATNHLTPNINNLMIKSQFPTSE